METSQSSSHHQGQAHIQFMQFMTWLIKLRKVLFQIKGNNNRPSADCLIISFR